MLLRKGEVVNLLFHTFRYVNGNSEKIIGRYILDRGTRDKVKFVQVACLYVYMWVSS